MSEAKVDHQVQRRLNCWRRWIRGSRREQETIDDSSIRRAACPSTVTLALANVRFFAPVAVSRLDLRSKKRQCFKEESREIRVGGTI